MNIELISKELSHLSSLSILIPFILLLMKIKALNSQFNALLVYIISSIITEIVGLCFLNNDNINLPVYYLFTILETTLISYIFIKEVKEKHYISFLIIGFIIFLISSTFGLLWYKSFFHADNFLRPFEFALILIYSLVFFYKTILNLNIKDLLNYYFFWFNSAFLIYFGTSFIFFLLLPYVAKENIYFINILGIFHLVMSIIYNTLLSIGIWKIKKD